MEENEEEKKEEQVAQGVKQQAKKGAKKLSKKLLALLIKILPYVLLVLAGIAIIASIIKFLSVLNGSYKADMKGNVPATVEKMINEKLGNNLKIKQDGSGYDIDIEAFVDELIDKLYEDGSVLPTYIKKYNQKEYLTNFIKAELVTQNFKIGDADPLQQDEFNGAIKVNRRTTENATVDLEYIDYDTFQQYVDEGNRDVFNYYTVDGSGMLVIAQYVEVITKITSDVPGIPSSSNTSLTISQTSIDYKAMLDAYAMPFDFLWALLVKSTEEEFVNEVAKLALESEITITAFDNLTTTVETETTGYEVEITHVTTDNETGEIKVTTETETRHVTKEVTTNTDTVFVNVTYADVWVVKYSIEYTQEVADLTPITEGEVIPKENATKQKTNSGTSITEKDTTYSMSSSSKIYKEGTPVVEEKTDPAATEENFVTLLKKYKYAEINIMQEVDWLFEMMETSSKTSDMIDLVKYLLYKATGVNLGVTSLDENYFVSKSLSSMYSGARISVNKTSISREDFIKCIKEYSKDSGYQTRFAQYAGKIYDICVSKNINPILCAAQAGCESGFGAATPANSPWNYWGLAVYNDSNTGKTFNNIDEAITFYCDTILSYQKPGSIAYAKAQLYAPYSDKITGNMNSIYDVYSAYMFLGERHNGRMWDGVNVKQYLVKYLHLDCTHGLEDPTTLEEQAAYVVAYIDNNLIAKAKEIFGSKIYSGGIIIEMADMIKKYMAQNSYTYCVLNNVDGDECAQYGKSHGLNNTFEASKTGDHNTCCATYVSWVLQEAGYMKAGHCVHGAPALASVLINTYGWKKVSVAEAQAGDVLYYPNVHIDIYAGNNTKYNAGKGAYIRDPNPQANFVIPSSVIVLRAP